MFFYEPSPAPDLAHQPRAQVPQQRALAPRREVGDGLCIAGSPRGHKPVVPVKILDVDAGGGFHALCSCCITISENLKRASSTAGSR